MNLHIKKKLLTSSTRFKFIWGLISNTLDMNPHMYSQLLFFWSIVVCLHPMLMLNLFPMGQTKGGSSHFGLQIEQVHPKHTTAQVDLGRVSSCIQGDSFLCTPGCHMNYKCTNLLNMWNTNTQENAPQKYQRAGLITLNVIWTQYCSSSLTSCNQIHEHILMVANFPGNSACYPLCIQDHLQGYLMHNLSRRYLTYSVCSVSNLTTARRFDKNWRM